jgi:hypothetical protein
MVKEKVEYREFTPKRKFGVEIEVSAHISREALKEKIRTVDLIREIVVSDRYVQDYNNNYWHVKFDRSCSDIDFPYGWEISSYVASSVDDLTMICKVTDCLRKGGVKANDNCAVHVHVDASDYTIEELASLVANWIKMEKIIKEAVPRRRITGVYSKLLSHHYRGVLSVNCSYEPVAFYNLILPRPRADGRWRLSDRRLALNLTNWVDCHLRNNQIRKTIELRLPEGSLEPNNVKNWIVLFVHFISFCKRVKFPKVLTAYELVDTLIHFGIHNKNPMIVDSYLWEAKVWFLNRVIKYSSNNVLRKECVDLLNHICSPYKIYKYYEKRDRKRTPQVSRTKYLVF